jgi:hypothetical protein
MTATRPQPLDNVESPGPDWVAEEKRTLSSRLWLRHRYPFNRNAPLAAIPTPAGIVALTWSGNLLPFDAKSFELTREHALTSAGLGLFNGGPQGLLVSCTDGTLSRVTRR